MEAKPTFNKPQSDQAKKLDKTIKTDFLNNNVDQLLTEKEFSIKKKIFSLAKMEALVFSDPKLTKVYNDMSKNGEEKYGYHYNETIMNIIFNDYVLNSPHYLQKYKMARPIKKRRRDKSGINQIKKAANPEEKETAKKNYEKRMKAKTPEDIYGKKTEVDETTSAASSGAYETPAAWSKTRKPEKQKKPFYLGGTVIAEGKYLTDPQAFFKFINEAIPNKEDSEEYRVPIDNWQNLPSYKKIIELNTDDTHKLFKLVFDRFLNDGYISCYDLDELASKYNIDEEELEIIILKYYFDKFIKPDSKNELPPEKIETIKSIPELKNSFIPESKLNEKSKSKAQQRFFGMVDAVKKGELSPEKVGNKVVKAAKEMSTKDIEDFASTKHKDLPEKVDEDTDNEWQGVDADLETSLFEYGFVAKQRKDRDYSDEWFVLYKIDDNHYGWAHIRESDLDALINGTDWLDPKNIENFLSYVGKTKEEWLQESFVNKLSDLLGYFGPQNLFGVEYHPIDKEAALDMINNNNVDEAIIDAMDDSMKMKTEPTGTVGNNVPTGPETQNTGGGGMMENKNNTKTKNNIMEDFKALNKELEIVEKYQKKLEEKTNLFEDRKPSALVLKDRMGKENEKNFKSDFNKSDTKQQLDVQKELQWKDQQSEIKDPQKLGKDLEKNELKNTKGEALKNVGNSTNNKGDEVPKRNRTEAEQDEVDLYKKGLGDYVYDNKPDERFEKRMERDMGEKNYKLRKARQEFEADAPMYNKDTFPTENGEKKVQYDKERSSWNDRFGLKESLLSGAYENAINKRHTVTFKLNEVEEIKDPSNLFKLDFRGLSNLYDNYGNVNEEYVEVIKEYDFYTDGEKVYVHSKQITENEEKTKIDENEYNHLKHLINYNTADFINSKKNSKTRDIIKLRKK